MVEGGGAERRGQQGMGETYASGDCTQHYLYLIKFESQKSGLLTLPHSPRFKINNETTHPQLAHLQRTGNAIIGVHDAPIST